MTVIEERILVYIALAVICAFLAAFTGLLAGALSFMQIAAIIEALFWFGVPGRDTAKYRQQRILFNQ
jgi:hypothetical protein